MLIYQVYVTVKIIKKCSRPISIGRLDNILPTPWIDMCCSQIQVQLFALKLLIPYVPPQLRSAPTMLFLQLNFQTFAACWIVFGFRADIVSTSNYFNSLRVNVDTDPCPLHRVLLLAPKLLTTESRYKPVRYTYNNVKGNIWFFIQRYLLHTCMIIYWIIFEVRKLYFLLMKIKWLSSRRIYKVSQLIHVGLYSHCIFS